MSRFWTSNPALVSLLRSINFTIPPDESMTIVKTHKNEMVRPCHPDKTFNHRPEEIVAAAAAIRMWNEAYKNIEDFIEVSVEDGKYDSFTNGNIGDINDYMNNFGIWAIENKRVIEQKREEDLYNAQIIKNAKIAAETKRNIANIYDEEDAAYIGMYMFVYMYM
jgi:hypothetical protein